MDEEDDFAHGPWILPQHKQPEFNLTSAINKYKLAPTPKHADMFLTAARPIIDTAIKSYSQQDTPAIRARAKSILLDTVHKYDPSITKPKTYFLTHLQGLRRYSTQATSMIRAPEQRLIDAGRVDKHLQELKIELGRDPSDSELADRTGIPIKRIAQARSMPRVTAASSAPEWVIPDAKGDELTGGAPWQQFVYHDLDPISQVVMEHSLGMHGKPVLGTTEIAKVVNMSAGAVSQRKANIDRILSQYSSLFAR